MSDRPSFLLLNAERIQDYCPGGLHPIHIGDTLSNERYRILRKLGHGAFSAVWLASDRTASSPKFVAIKVCRSDSSHDEREQRMHEILLQSGDHKSLQDHVVTLLDSFRHIGPNGSHSCLVFEPMGPDMNSLFRERPNSSRWMPYDIASQAVKQLLQGLHCLHQHRIAYCDINFGNLLTTVSSDGLTNALSHDLNTDRANEIHTTSQPARLYKDRSLAEFVDHSTNITIKFSDLGAAFPSDNPPQDPIVPIALRAPELVLGGKFDHSIDIWSFGCLVFEILTGDTLFAVVPLPFDTDAQTDDSHLLQMFYLLGPLPPSQFARWARGTRYFDASMTLIRSDVGDDPVEPGQGVYVGPSLEEKFMKRKPEQMSASEVRLVLAFLRRALQYDPKARPTTAQLLADPWIESIDDLWIERADLTHEKH